MVKIPNTFLYIISLGFVFWDTIAMLNRGLATWFLQRDPSRITPLQQSAQRKYIRYLNKYRALMLSLINVDLLNYDSVPVQQLLSNTGMSLPLLSFPYELFKTKPELLTNTVQPFPYNLLASFDTVHLIAYHQTEKGEPITSFLREPSPIGALVPLPVNRYRKASTLSSSSSVISSPERSKKMQVVQPPLPVDPSLIEESSAVPVSATVPTITAQTPYQARVLEAMAQKTVPKSRSGKRTRE